MSAAAPAWVTSLLCPTLGTMLCTLMWLSPLKAVLDARNNLEIGSLNPMPFGITVVNCIGWTIYACMKKDYFIFWANMPGLVLGLYYCLSILPFLSKKNPTPNESLTRMIIELLVIGGSFFWAYISMIVFIIFSPEDKIKGENIVGYTACTCTLLYYASPLSTLSQVISTRDSSSLYVPMILTNLSNATLWVSYGVLGVHDPVVWGPNLIGVVLSVIQLTISVMFHPTPIYTRISNACGGKNAKHADSIANIEGAVVYSELHKT